MNCVRYAGGCIVQRICKHEQMKFHSVQRLGRDSVELWQCSECKSTMAQKTRRRAAVAAA